MTRPQAVRDGWPGTNLPPVFATAGPRDHLLRFLLGNQPSPLVVADVPLLAKDVQRATSLASAPVVWAKPESPGNGGLPAMPGSRTQPAPRSRTAAPRCTRSPTASPRSNLSPRSRANPVGHAQQVGDFLPCWCGAPTSQAITRPFA